MTISKVFAIAFATGLTVATGAHAGFNGDNVTGTFIYFGSPVISFGTQTVGPGVEFTGNWVDDFDQSWNISVDVFDTGITLSWTESTRAGEPNGGNISANPDSFGFDFSFGSSVLPTFDPGAGTFSSAGNYSPHVSNLTNIILTTPNSVHFGFSRMDSTDFYTITAVPELETYTMMLAGLGLMSVFARRRTAT